MRNESTKRILLMRGLPSCGKSHRARELAEQTGGQCFEFDQFFESKSDGSFHWSRKLLPEARIWHFNRIREAVEAGVETIVVDDDHRPGPSAKAVVALGLFAGYEFSFEEPTSPWWKTIRRALLEHSTSPQAKQYVEELGRWAEKLTIMSKSTHRVPLGTFIDRMNTWNPSLSIGDLLAWNEGVAA